MDAFFQPALDLAEDQSGTLSRTQAGQIGLTDRHVDVAIADGLLVPVCRGIFRIRGAPQSEAMAVAAAALRYRGCISQATAARRLRLEAPLRANPVHVLVDARDTNPRSGRIRVRDDRLDQEFFVTRVHRTISVGALTRIDGIACTDAARTLIDIAPLLTPEQLEVMFERARKLGLLSTTSLARRFGELGGSGRAGTRKVRELLANAEPGVLDSKLEVLAWRMLRASSLPAPARQYRVNSHSRKRYRLDFAWPELLIAFETEGFEWHGSRARWKQDRIRTAALERLGWRIVVATWEDVTQSPVVTLDRIASALAERRRLSRLPR